MNLLLALIRFSITLPFVLIQELREQPFDYESRTSYYNGNGEQVERALVPSSPFTDLITATDQQNAEWLEHREERGYVDCSECGAHTNGRCDDCGLSF